MALELMKDPLLRVGAAIDIELGRREQIIVQLPLIPLGFGYGKDQLGLQMSARMLPKIYQGSLLMES